MLEKAKSDARPVKSKLTGVGCLLMLAGVLVAPFIAGRVAGAPEGLRLPLALLADGLRVGALLGVAFLLIGLLRNRRAKKLAARRAEREPEEARTDGAG